ncbi:unnamed protein product [Microthlaspi erraticum]|uniref:Protein kinase domain-containing protein n=1 Tax=Microthlaspi erraticum TaxID=1685480 RepID=A0A6D2HMF7_9BRAS|nr:unnamed protein product [Microthlaspi erraticum]
MSRNSLLPILCFALALSFGFVSSQSCGKVFFSRNGTYDVNRRLVLSTLASNVSSRNGFYNVSVGQGSGRIYALGLCIPETDPNLCSACIQAASDSLSRNCPDQTDSWEWKAGRTLCFVRYSNGLFFDQIELEPSQAIYTSSGRFQGNITAYTNIWDAFISSMISRAGQTRYLADVSPRTGNDSFIYSEEPYVSRSAISAVMFVVFLAFGLVIWKRSYRTSKLQTDDDMTSPQSLQFDFATIEVATDKFSRTNKLGQGGFGEVYKGMLPNGTEIAVKRLSRNSGQGTQEFKNEVVIVAKLQHKNLVRLLGFCLERDEQILIYEFVPNKSLDYFLFDPTKKRQLDWKRRYNIIEGITRGLLYLHQDSRLTIIHRDIKAGNILLDADMSPKIADFGMARNFRVDQTEDETGRIVGTFGYMPPEYVTRGHFSTKSDVYSFGVLILEIVCGKKNSSFYQMNDDSGGNMVTHIWRLWNNESPLDLIDPTIKESYEKDEVIRCIHIGLLCVQESPADRPAMSTIFQMLTNRSIVLPVPRPPGFFFRDRSNLDPLTYGSEPGHSRCNSVSYSVLTPR